MNQYTYTLQPGMVHHVIPNYEVTLLLQCGETGGQLYNIVAENVRVDNWQGIATLTDSFIDKLSEMGYDVEDDVEEENSCWWRIEIKKRHAAQVLDMVIAELVAQGATVKDVIRIE